MFCPACYMCTMCLDMYLVQWWTEGVRSFRTGVTGSFKLPCRCWELNLSPLQEQVFLPLHHLSSPKLGHLK